MLESSTRNRDARVGERVVALGVAAVLGHREVRAVACRRCGRGPGGRGCRPRGSRRCRAAAGSRRRRTAATDPGASRRRPCRRCRARSRAPPGHIRSTTRRCCSMPLRRVADHDERERHVLPTGGAVANSPSHDLAADLDAIAIAARRLEPVDRRLGDPRRGRPPACARRPARRRSASPGCGLVELPHHGDRRRREVLEVRPLAASSAAAPPPPRPSRRGQARGRDATAVASHRMAASPRIVGRVQDTRRSRSRGLASTTDCQR